MKTIQPDMYQYVRPASPESRPAAGFRRLYGGGRRIRTSEVADDRFTVCSLWPLGNPSRDDVRTSKDPLKYYGAPYPNRTDHLLITSQLLYQYELTGPRPFVWQKETGLVYLKKTSSNVKH